MMLANQKLSQKQILVVLRHLSFAVLVYPDVSGRGRSLRLYFNRQVPPLDSAHKRDSESEAAKRRQGDF